MQKPRYQGLMTFASWYSYVVPLLSLCILLPLLSLTILTSHLAYAHSSTPRENNGLAQTPLLGWSSWSSIRTNPTASNIEAQAQALSTNLKSSGYQYVNLDDFWYLNPSTNVDQYGRWSIDTSRFPNGIASVATYVHSLGLKFGIYLTPGIPVAAVQQNTPIQGTSYHASDIAITSQYENNYNYGGSVMYYIDYSKPGAQAYINSWADQLASWGVDYLKMDGVGDWDIPDVQAWSSALKQSGRSIYFSLSNSLDVNNVSTWKQNANDWRIDNDIECYCSTLTTWSSVSTRFSDAPAWTADAGPGGWNNLDSLDVGNGSKDGLTNDERQSYMTLWAASAAPLSLGDDLTTLDSYGLSLLTNNEVIAIDQAGHPAHPISQSTSQQVWYANNGDGTYTVALFNLGSSSATVTANWSDIGFSGSATVHDAWSHTDLGSFNGSFSATLNSHASRLLKVTASSRPGGCAGLSGYYTIVNRNSGKNIDVYSDSTSNNADIVQYTNNNQADQQWSFQDAGGGYCKIVNRHSGLLLNIPGPTTTQGTQLIQYQDDGNANSQWSLTSIGSGYYTIVSRYDSQLIDVQNLSTADNAPVIQWPSNNGANQQWQFSPA
jgi:alpha-galactosidase